MPLMITFGFARASTHGGNALASSNFSLFSAAADAASRLLPRRPDYQITPLLTQSEHVFFVGLVRHTGPDRHVLTKIRIADLIQPRTGHRQFRALLNRIQAKHIDFVIIEVSSGKVLFAIELDDRTHQRADRIARDDFVNACFNQAGITLLRVPAARKYDFVEILNQN